MKKTINNIASIVWAILALACLGQGCYWCYLAVDEHSSSKMGLYLALMIIDMLMIVVMYSNGTKEHFVKIMHILVFGKQNLPKDTEWISKKDILIYAREHPKFGLCYTLSEAMSHFAYDMCIRDVFPAFTFENAKRFGAIQNTSGYWWDVDTWNTGRMAFLNWLIEVYENDYIKREEL